MLVVGYILPGVWLGQKMGRRKKNILKALPDAIDLLSISVATVETHRGHILQKLDVHSTAELVLYAVRRGVIT